MMPRRKVSTHTTKITPVSTAKDGRNLFRVEAELGAHADERLRPGMEGVAKIEVTHFDSDGAGPDSTYAAWWIETPNESNSINPPISYGVVPTGADEVVPEQLLISGHHYRVAIYVWDAPLGDYFLQASGEFDRP